MPVFFYPPLFSCREREEGIKSAEFNEADLTLLGVRKICNVTGSNGFINIIKFAQVSEVWL